MQNFFKRRSAEAEKTIHAYRRLFSTEDGQIVLKDLAKSCFLNRSVIGKDTHETYMNEGVRSVIIRIFQTCEMTEKEIEALRKQMLAEEKDIFND